MLDLVKLWATPLVVVCLQVLVSSSTNETLFSNSTQCFSSASCDCTISNGTICKLYGNVSNSSGCVIDNHLYDSLSLTLDCRKNEKHVDLICVIDVFPSLTELRLIDCDYADPSFFPLDQHLEWEVDFNWARAVGGSTGFFIRQKRNLSVSLNGHRECGLRSFTSMGILSNIRRLPILFLRRCPYLRYTHFENTSFSIVDGLDFAAMFISNVVIEVHMPQNFLHNVYRSFETDLMVLIKTCIQTKLQGWVEENKQHISNQSQSQWVHQMEKLIDKFRGWGNDTTRLTFVEFVNILSSIHGDDEDDKDDQRFIYLSYARSTLDHLNLAHNELTMVPIAIAGFTSLTELDLSNNKIEAISLGQSSSVLYILSRTLRFLDLSYNSIKILNGHMIFKIKGLTKLDLSYNFISSIRRDEESNEIKPIYQTRIKSFHSLQELILQRNKLDARGMENILIENVRRVDLSYNILDELNANVTSVFPNVVYLNLQHNKIYTIAKGSIKNLEKLNVLDLSYNSFNTLPAPSFMTNPRRSLGSRVNIILSNKIYQNRFHTYICDCNSVFAAEHNEFFTPENLDNYSYPHIDTPTDTNCTDREKDSKIELLKDKRSWLCHSADEILTVDYKNGSNLYHGTCPSACECNYNNNVTTFLQVDCSSQTLSTVPLISIDATDVSLSRNPFKTLSVKSFCQNYSTVNLLYLDYCSISGIGPNSFRYLSSLVYLSLIGNNLTTLDPNAFKYLNAMRYLNLRNNQFTSFQPTPFNNLSQLYNLILSNDDAVCDCTWEIHFLNWISQQNKDVSMYITPPQDCKLSDNVREYVPAPRVEPFHRATLQPICNRYEKAMKRALLVKQFWISFGASVAAVLLVSLSTFAGVYRWRHRIRSHMDSYLQSGFARAFISRYVGLQAHHEKEFDIGFLFHVNQTPEYYELMRYLHGTSRRNLKTICLGKLLPGSLALDEISKFATELHTCVILLTEDFLDDDQLVESFYTLLTTSLRKQTHINIIYIYTDRNILQSRDWFFLDIHLRHHCGLEFKKHLFWERFISSLPPPSERTDSNQTTQYDGRHDLRLLTENSRAFVDLCIICDSRQVNNRLRQLFDRYKNSISLCYVRDNKCFGEGIGRLQDFQNPSLNTVLGLSTQILVILTREFLENPWAKRIVKDCLFARLEKITFVGSVIILVEPHEFRGIVRVERFNYINDILDHINTRIVQWDGTESDWSVLDKEILTLSVPFSIPPDSHALDSEECDQLFYHNYVSLESTVNHQYNIFQQNAAAWATQPPDMSDVANLLTSSDNDTAAPDFRERNLPQTGTADPENEPYQLYE